MITAGSFKFTTANGLTFSDFHFRIPSVFAGQGAALLFDANKQPKAAYYAVADALAAATVQGVSAIEHQSISDRDRTIFTFLGLRALDSKFSQHKYQLCTDVYTDHFPLKHHRFNNDCQYLAANSDSSSRT